MLSQEQTEFSWHLVKGNRVEILMHMQLLLHRPKAGLSGHSTKDIFPKPLVILKLSGEYAVR